MNATHVWYVIILDLKIIIFWNGYGVGFWAVFHISWGNWSCQSKLVQGKTFFFSFLHFIHGFKLLHTQPYKQCFYATALQSLTHGCKALLHDHTWSVESMRLWRKAWLIHFVSVRQFEWQLEPDVDFALCCKAASPRSAVWNHSWASLCTTSQNNVLHFGNNEPRLKRSPLPKHLF